MSKMSQLHAELSEQAYELGFESISEAEERGYGVDWEKGKLLEPEEAAQLSLLQEKQAIIKLLGTVVTRSQFDRMVIEKTIKFIEDNVK